MDDVTLILGDALTELAKLPQGIDMIFTDPPYGHNNNNGDLIHRREAALGRPPSGGLTAPLDALGDLAASVRPAGEPRKERPRRAARCDDGPAGRDGLGDGVPMICHS